jgi:homotetrameric cytidine deaminase
MVDAAGVWLYGHQHQAGEDASETWGSVINEYHRSVIRKTGEAGYPMQGTVPFLPGKLLSTWTIQRPPLFLLSLRPYCMSSDSHVPLAALRAEAQSLTTRSYVPFSDAPAAAIVLLADGSWVPGVRVDSAAFSLSLSALMNAVTTTVALGRMNDIAAIVLSAPAQPSDRQYIDELLGNGVEAVDDDAWVRRTADVLPAMGEALDPFVEAEGTTPATRVAQARCVAERAYTPASGFPVGALLDIGEGRLLPGVNVEHNDWNRIVCAERNALGAAYAYGVADAIQGLYLSCPLDPDGTPCGACRQWLVELTPKIPLWMDRSNAPPDKRTPEALLPGSFSGRAIPRSSS